MIMNYLKVPRKNVNSSYIKAIGYHNETSTLIIEFNSGVIWSYTPITEKGNRDIMGAESQGKFFHKHIRNNSNVTAESLT